MREAGKCNSGNTVEGWSRRGGEVMEVEGGQEEEEWGDQVWEEAEGRGEGMEDKRGLDIGHG